MQGKTDLAKKMFLPCLIGYFYYMTLWLKRTRPKCHPVSKPPALLREQHSHENITPE